MIEDMKRQYLGLLISIGFVKIDDTSEFIDHYEVQRQTKWCVVPQAYNVHARSVPVVNAAIMAGLYPKLAERDGEVFFNKKLSGMKIHPSSILFGRQRVLSSDFLVYNTVVMNGDQVFLWESTTVDPVAVVLLAADMDIKVSCYFLCSKHQLMYFIFVIAQATSCNSGWMDKAGLLCSISYFIKVLENRAGMFPIKTYSSISLITV